MREFDKKWQHSTMLWLYSNTLGTVILGFYAITQGGLAFVMAPVIGFFAAGMSIPTIPLAVFLLPKVVALPTAALRVGGAFLAATALFMIPLAVVALLNTEYQFPASAIASLTLPFYAAALAATWLEYRPWLLGHRE